MDKIFEWLVATIAVAITAYLLPGVAVSGVFSALVTAIVIGIINTFIRPLIYFLTLPINILTLGLLTFVINALLIMLASMLVPGFTVSHFGWALLFSVILSIVNFFLKAVEPKQRMH
jgi:putative membrane protein